MIQRLRVKGPSERQLCRGRRAQHRVDAVGAHAESLLPRIVIERLIEHGRVIRRQHVAKVDHRPLRLRPRPLHVRIEKVLRVEHLEVVEERCDKVFTYFRSGAGRPDSSSESESISWPWLSSSTRLRTVLVPAVLLASPPAREDRSRSGSEPPAALLSGEWLETTRTALSVWKDADRFRSGFSGAVPGRSATADREPRMLPLWWRVRNTRFA